MIRVIDAIVVRGHRVASGACGDVRFPHGTIAPQLPWFQRLVADFDAYLDGPAFAGTINLDVGGAIAIGSPEIRLEAIAWTPMFPPETFFLSRGALFHRGARYPAFLYMPDPATKPDHPQPIDRVELLCARIDDLGYGDQVRLEYATAAVTIGAVAAGPSQSPD